MRDDLLGVLLFFLAVDKDRRRSQEKEDEWGQRINKEIKPKRGGRERHMTFAG